MKGKAYARPASGDGRAWRSPHALRRERERQASRAVREEMQEEQLQRELSQKLRRAIRSSEGDLGASSDEDE